VTLPTEPDAKHKAMAAKLEKMSGDAFDKAYMKQAGVQDHKTVHAKLMAASKKAKDPEVKALVDKTEPVVAQHLKSAEQMPMAKTGTTSGK
jgi:predicted outer membrane protein